MKCPKCKKEIMEGARFCPECGAPLTDDAMVEEILNNEEFKESYSDSGFWEKVKSVALKAGKKVIAEALLLWYVLQSPNVSLKKKSAIIAVLGYFISPIDLIPDTIPVVGFADDLIALIAVHDMIKSDITPEIQQQVDDKLKEWFG